MATSRSDSRSLLLLVLTSGFFITGILFDYMPIIVDNQIKRNIEVATNDEIQELWSKPPIDMHSYYWLYNITNPEQFMNGDKIRVQKVGPYHFTSRAEKKIIELSANKYRIIYNTTRHIHFNESEHELAYEQWKNSLTSNTNSGLISTKIDDNLTLLNAAYATMVEAARELASKSGDQQTQNMLIASSNRLAERFNETLILNMTARQALMGRKLIFVEKARKMIETFGIENKLPNVLDNDIFGYVALMNETQLGPYEIYTGYQASMSSLGDIISYQGKRRYSEYRGKCNRLQASAGELRPMPIMDGQILEMSVPGFCRIIRLVPTGLKKLREGIAIGYTHHLNDFKNSTYNPDNECFCVNGTADTYCSLNGAIELAPCSYYSPVVLTTSVIEPDPRIITSIADFEPELLMSDVDSVPKADNQAQLLILRRVGIPIKADITYTLFGKVIRDPKFRQTASIPEVSYIPMVMIREMATIPAELGQIVVNLENFLTLTQHMKVIMYLSSIVLLCWLTGHYYNQSTQDRVVPSNGSWHHSTCALGRTNDSLAPSDRANSADSSRSQPPSRIISRAGSIDINGGGRSPSTTSASTNQVTSDCLVSQTKQQKQVISSKKMLSNQQKALHQTSNNLSSSSGSEGSIDDNSGTTTIVEGTPKTAATTTKTINEQKNLSNQDVRSNKQRIRAPRFFSKVDEELDLEREEQRKSATNNNMKNVAQDQSGISINQLGSEVNLNEKKTNIGDNSIHGLKNKRTITIEDNKLKSDSSFNGENGQIGSRQEKQANTQIRKSWFMKVCSNFARILSGIRGTISEASQLDIRDNDYHDKQLEVLAGKIDNWYNSNANTESTTATSTTEKNNTIVTDPGEGSICTLPDQNTDDSGLKSGLRVDVEQQEFKKMVDNNSKLKDEANNKAQVDNSESSNKITPSKSEQLPHKGIVEKEGGQAGKVTQKEVVELNEKVIKGETSKDNRGADKAEAEVRVKEAKEAKEEYKKEKSENNVVEMKGEEKKEDEEGDEKAKISQTGSMRRKRTIKKKTLASEGLMGSQAVGYEPLNGDTISTPTATSEKTDDTEKIDLKLTPDQEIDARKVSTILEQSSLSNEAKLPPNGVVLKSNDAHLNLTQNSTTDQEDEDLETEIGVEDDDEEEEEEEEEEDVDDDGESSNGLVSSNGTCIETNHRVNRADLVQSNQRIINKSDTSGDESVEAASLVSAKQNKEDKAAAFEQMEMAMAIAQ